MAYSIGEIAKQLGVSAATIRLWEVKGWIPKGKRTIAGHRQYDQDDIVAMREFITSHYTKA